MTIIPLVNHPANRDPTAVCITHGRDLNAIYKTRLGFVACLAGGLSVDGYFPTREAAREAQVAATG